MIIDFFHCGPCNIVHIDLGILFEIKFKMVLPPIKPITYCMSKAVLQKGVVLS